MNGTVFQNRVDLHVRASSSPAAEIDSEATESDKELGVAVSSVNRQQTRSISRSTAKTERTSAVKRKLKEDDVDGPNMDKVIATMAITAGVVDTGARTAAMATVATSAPASTPATPTTIIPAAASATVSSGTRRTKSSPTPVPTLSSKSKSKSKSKHAIASESKPTAPPPKVATKRKPRPKALPSTLSKENGNESADSIGYREPRKKLKRKPSPPTAVFTFGSQSDTLSSGSSSSDDDDDHKDRPKFRANGRSSTTIANGHTASRGAPIRSNGNTGSEAANSNGNRKSASLPRRSQSSSSSARPSSRKKTIRSEQPIPDGLRKLPKGYVYDTEINPSLLMGLSVNPSQTGEFMEHLKGKNAKENDYPDRRAEFNLDYTQEPSIFGIEQQTGYTYPRLRNGGKGRLPKVHCEDGFVITDLLTRKTEEEPPVFLGRLFCVTDGHGGRGCSAWVIQTISHAMQVIFERYKPADLSNPATQELIKFQVSKAVGIMDTEYLEYKKKQYLLYKAKKIPHDPGSDGTTLIVNIFIDKWIICINVGDSRSLLCSRDSDGRWDVEFHSEDHTPSLERLVQTIYANGGEFVTHDDKLIRFDPKHKNDKKHRQALKEARIRVKDGASNIYGIPYRTQNGHCASVNLGACLGDVLYKLDPVKPVLNCTPDVTFIDITNIEQGFLLMASDGLWDYVQRGSKVQEQNSTVCQFVGDKLDRGWHHQRIMVTLADREGGSGLYTDSIQEYDDFTAILIPFNQQQLLTQQKKRLDYERQLEKRQQLRVKERQLMMIRQQQLIQEQKQRELDQLHLMQQLKIRRQQEDLRKIRQQQEILREQQRQREVEEAREKLAKAAALAAVMAAVEEARVKREAEATAAAIAAANAAAASTQAEAVVEAAAIATANKDTLAAADSKISLPQGPGPMETVVVKTSSHDGANTLSGPTEEHEDIIVDIESVSSPIAYSSFPDPTSTGGARSNGRPRHHGSDNESDTISHMPPSPNGSSDSELLVVD
ncbi:hypothetical protein EMPS_01861 [Entomortierella parvispora]|uniref:PPM-type phosphatase domain-containing protein n=1 Tax=Entomortierella parvispora TaxID=205924 RepID=A0A9P3H3V2_9FUNG|nr:hypothetical protein EMPS_01861 [Entomortierella parvispora]